MTKRQSMRKLLSVLLLLILVVSSLPFKPQVNAATAFETLKFDFGAAGVESGFIGVSATEKYSSTKGYGFESTSAVQNVTASGTGANADAVRFLSDIPNHVFSVDLPQGVYKITVTTGDVESTTITAEGVSQLFFLTGSNATDSFTIPVTDGQLNIYPSSGVGGNYSLSSLVIEQESTGTTTKPTIWVSGDSTVASYYNVSDDALRGWGQYLPYYVDTNVYDVRNISVSGVTSSDVKRSLFPTIEYYGKPGDIFILSVGINDYTSAYKANSSNPYATTQKTTYETNLKDLVSRAKAKGMTVYLVKQQSELDDCDKYPLPTKKWFSDVIDSVAASENVGIIDLFTPWLQFCVTKTKKVASTYYYNNLHPNKNGANILAQMVSEALFPTNNPPSGGGTTPSVPNLTIDAKDPSTIVYETEVFGGPVVNPHKGYVMTVYSPWTFDPNNPLGIGGSKNNKAWDMVTICSGAPYWKDLNPAEGVYDWSSIDAVLAECEKYGMTYGIRVIPYSSSVGSDANYGKDHDLVPQWVYDKGAKHTIATYKWENTSTQLKIPDWSDPIYLQACKDFAKAMAEKYDGDPRIEFIDIRPFGDWGEWHTSSYNGSDMPSVEIQKDMLFYYKSVFKKTLIAVPSDASGEVYEYALSIGITKRNDGMIMAPNAELDLIPAYEANLPTIAENHNTYEVMLQQTDKIPGGYLKWTPDRFRNVINTAHLSIYALDQASDNSYKFYTEQKDVIEEMVNKMGYNFTVISAMSNGNKLEVAIENTGLASCFFNIDLCAEVTDINGNKIASFGSPIRIEKASFHDGDVNVYTFEYNGTLKDGEVICLAMYEPDNYLVAGKDPTVKFDNKNTLPNKKLMLVPVTNYNPVPGGNTDPSVPSHTHNVTLVNEVPATCDKAGSKAYYVCNCGMKFEDQSCAKEITDIVIPATGHTYSTTWTTNSTNHWHVCSKCGAKKDNVTHTWNYSSATEEHDKHCTVCGYVAQAKLQHTHKGTLVSGKSATCTATGTKAYYTCTCGKYFEDSSCTKEITNINTWKVIAATGHAYSTTWTTNSTNHWHVCSKCGAKKDNVTHTWNYSAATEDHDKHCTVCGYVAQEKLQHTHKGTLVSGKSATCTATGTKSYYTCTCGKYFEDSSCTKEITNINTWKVIPATGHTYSTAWTSDEYAHWNVCTTCNKAVNNSASHTWNYGAATEDHDKHCTICGYVDQPQLNHTHKGTSVASKSATCTANGSKAYYTCTCGKYFEDQACTKEITNINTWKVIAATGHTYSTTWTTNSTNHWHVCTKCGTKKDNVTHTWNYSSATEEHDKHCTVCGYVAQEKLQHTHNGTYVAAKQATCTAEGNVAYYSCSCGKKFSDSACTKEITNVKTPVTEHNYYTSWSISSTNHWHECKNCKAKKDNVTHIWNYPEATEDHSKSCTVCGYVAQLKLQHTHKGTLISGKSATCTTDGTKSYYTCTCGKYFEDSSCTKEITDINTWKVIKATGHVPGAAATATTAQICTVCKVELAPALGGGNNTSGGNTGNGGSTITNPTPVVTPSPVVTPVVTPVPTQKPSTPVATPTPVVTPVPETGLAGFIERLYNVALSRNSEPAGKEYWINEVKFNNQTGSDVANGFLVSDEFLSKQMSNSDFLEVLYKTFFDRTSDAQGKAYWLDLMNNGYSKKDVINGFCNSTEWANLCLTYGIPSGSSAKPTIVIEPNEGTKAFVTRLYETCLGRAPEQGGFEYWTYRLANLEDRGYSAAEGFFFSDEFVAKKLDNSTYVTLLYRTILGREPDEAGLNYWLGLMKNGMSKKDVLKGFAASNEWADICSNYGILK